MNRATMASTLDSIQTLENGLRRSTGLRDTVGHIRKGRTGASAQPSIPLRFKTYYVRDNADTKHGFSSTDIRFNSRGSSEVPGPGTYGSRSSMIKEGGSVSKKGSGVGFVSKAHRFQLASRDSIAPTSYNPYRNNSSLSSQVDHNRAANTSNFRQPIAHVDHYKKLSEQPAPNQYSVSRGKNRSRREHGTSVPFKSRSVRTTTYINDIPAPGTYDPHEDIQYAVPRAAHAVFTSRTERQFLSNSQIASNPGPGAYSPYSPPPVQKPNNHSRLHYLPIAASAVRMPPELLSPGPGHYDLMNAGTDKRRHHVTSAVFMSTVKRKVEGEAEVHIPLIHANGDKFTAALPGPAHYRPYAVDRSSFNYNAGRKWI